MGRVLLVGALATLAVAATSQLTAQRHSSAKHGECGCSGGRPALVVGRLNSLLGDGAGAIAEGIECIVSALSSNASVSKATARYCCEALTADCLACNAGLSVEEFCSWAPGTAGCPCTCGEPCLMSPADTEASGTCQADGRTCAQNIVPPVCPSPAPCCTALTARCLACAEGVATREYCGRYPATAGCPQVDPPRACCRAMTAECLACGAGVPERVFCKRHPDVPGCVDNRGEGGDSGRGSDGGRVCCEALTSSCLACSAGVSEREYCAANPRTVGCDRLPGSSDGRDSDGGEGHACCMAMTSSCLACSAGVSEREYCAANPRTVGCDRLRGGSDGGEGMHACCMAMTSSCLACSAGVSEREYCAANPRTVGCDRLRGSDSCPCGTTCTMASGSQGVCQEDGETCAQNIMAPNCPPRSLPAPYPHPDGGRSCCEALTAECQACAMGVDIRTFCAKQPDTPGCYGARVCECGTPCQLSDAETGVCQADSATCARQLSTPVACPRPSPDCTGRCGLRCSMPNDAVGVCLADQRTCARLDGRPGPLCPAPKGPGQHGVGKAWTRCVAHAAKGLSPAWPAALRRSGIVRRVMGCAGRNVPEIAACLQGLADIHLSCAADGPLDCGRQPLTAVGATVALGYAKGPLDRIAGYAEKLEDALAQDVIRGVLELSGLHFARLCVIPPAAAGASAPGDLAEIPASYLRDPLTCWAPAGAAARRAALQQTPQDSLVVAEVLAEVAAGQETDPRGRFVRAVAAAASNPASTISQALTAAAQASAAPAEVHPAPRPGPGAGDPAAYSRRGEGGSSSDSNELSVLCMVGIVVGALVVVALAVLGVWCYIRRSRERRESSTDKPLPALPLADGFERTGSGKELLKTLPTSEGPIQQGVVVHVNPIDQMQWDPACKVPNTTSAP